MKRLFLLSALVTLSAFAQEYKVVETISANREVVKYFCQFTQNHLKSEKSSLDMAECLASAKQQDFVEGVNYDNAIIHGDVHSNGKVIHCSWFVKPTIEEALAGNSRKIICE